MNTKDLRAYCALAKAAYGVSPGTLICGERTFIVRNELKDANTSTEGIIVRDERNVVISMRGTQEGRDWITDLETMRVTPSFGQGTCAVHAGFWKAVSSVWPQIEATLGLLAGRFGAQPLIVTGHSLGGALASLIGVMAASTGWAYPSVVTFGSPRVGDAAWAGLFSLICPESLRIVHASDAVPDFPGYLDGYRHVSSAVVVHDDGSWEKTADGISVPVALLKDIAAHPIARYEESMGKVPTADIVG